MPQICIVYSGICLKTEENHGKTSVRVRLRIAPFGGLWGKKHLTHSRSAAVQVAVSIRWCAESLGCAEIVCPLACNNFAVD